MLTFELIHKEQFGFKPACKHTSDLHRQIKTSEDKMKLNRTEMYSFPPAAPFILPVRLPV